jgi:hypothetical protein
MEKEHEMLLPPAVAEGMSLREWLTGCALSNPSLVSNDAPDVVAKKAVTIADEVMLALKAPPSPTRTAPLSERSMKAWGDRIEVGTKHTMPAIPSQKRSGEHPALKRHDAIAPFPPQPITKPTIRRFPSSEIAEANDDLKAAARSIAPPEPTTYRMINRDAPKK